MALHFDDVDKGEDVAVNADGDGNEDEDGAGRGCGPEGAWGWILVSGMAWSHC